MATSISQEEPSLSISVGQARANPISSLYQATSPLVVRLMQACFLAMFRQQEIALPSSQAHAAAQEPSRLRIYLSDSRLAIHWPVERLQG